MIILWTLNRDLGHFPHKNLHHLLDVWMLTQAYYFSIQPSFCPFTLTKSTSFTWCLDANTRAVILWALNRGSGPFTLTKTLSLAWCLDAHSGMFSLGPQPRFWPYYCCLVLPRFQDTYACKLSHRVLSSMRQTSSLFFQGALPLTAVSVFWGCYKSFFRVTSMLRHSKCPIKNEPCFTLITFVGNPHFSIAVRRVRYLKILSQGKQVIIFSGEFKIQS